MRTRPLAGLALAAALALPAPAGAAEGADLLKQVDGALQRLVARVSPAVVQIQVTGYGAEGAGRGDASVLVRQRTIGSGVVVDADGWIMTNQHVVRGAQRIRVVLPPPGGEPPKRGSGPARSRVYEARVVGTHAESDLALLKIEAKGLPTLPLRSAHPPREGQLVFAVGSPEGLASTVTMGVISSVARQADPSVPMLFIQTDAPINPGNSGGPLVDIDGAVVGLNAFILSQSGGSQGLGFAVPAPVVEFVYQGLRTRGHVHRVELGVAVTQVTPTLAAGLGLARDYGVLVTDVAPGGPAEKAGVQRDDLVEAVDGRAVESLPALSTALYLHPPGGPVRVLVRRGDATRLLEVAGAEPSHPAEQVAALASPERDLVPRLGFLGVEVDPARLPELAASLRVPSGVVVAARTADPSAVESGLLAFDVIHALNRTAVTTLGGLRTLLAALPAGAPVVLQIERQGQLQYLAFELE
jgi:serine protease Do